MGKTNIQWTEYNWNPFTGCTPVSPGCVNCYARKNARRLQGNPKTERYRKGFEFTIHPECLDEPLTWKKPRKVFVNTMSDTFHEDAPLEAIQQIFELMVKCPQHVFQVLTKRAERMAELSVKLHWPENVWGGVTVENADYLHRLDFLRQVPAKVRFVSFEPLLSPIPSINFHGIHWAIVGGESGPKARAMDLDWARDIRDQCQRARIPFFFKQAGGKGRDKGGRHLDGKEWSEYPDAEPPAANPQKDKKVADTIKGTVVRGDTPFPWMVKGTVSHKSDGTCNVLVIVPHGHPDNDANAEKLGAYLADALDSYAVINNQKYRKPRKNEALDRLRGVMDLNKPGQAPQCKEDYWSPIITFAKEINDKAKSRAILLFIHGMAPKPKGSNATNPNIAIGKGFIGEYDAKAASGSKEFFDELLLAITKQEMSSVRDDVGGYSGRGKLPPHMYKNRRNLGIDIEAVQLEFRSRGYRDTPQSQNHAGEKLAAAIKGMSSFKQWRSEEMTAKKAREAEEKDDLGKEAMKEVPKGPERYLAPTDPSITIIEPANERVGKAATQAKQPQPPLASRPDQDVNSGGSQVELISAEKFMAQIDALRQSTTIKNDDDEEVAFDGETKEEFIRFCQEGYPVVERMMAAVYETGRFLHEVRKILKPKKLFLTWMNFTGLQERRSYRYLKVYERFGDHLSEFAHLGIRKLLAASQLKNCVEYLEKHVEDAEKQTVEQFEHTIRKLRASKKKSSKGRPPTYEEIAGCKLRRSGDGTRIVVEGLSKKKQQELFEAIKALLSKEKS